MQADDARRGTVTRLLADARDGKPDADNLLFRYVQADLRRLAQSILSQSRRPDSVLGGTELVSMAVLRLIDREHISADNRAQFFFMLGRAMHDVLIEENRRAAARKRGGGWTRVALVEFAVDDEKVVVDPLDLSAAVAELTAQDSEAGQVLHLRFFAGLSLDEVALTTQRPLSSVRASWEYSRAWLIRRLSDPSRRNIGRPGGDLNH